MERWERFGIVYEVQSVSEKYPKIFKGGRREAPALKCPGPLIQDLIYIFWPISVDLEQTVQITRVAVFRAYQNFEKNKT